MVGRWRGSMGKRSDFERAPRDYYRTPKAAVLPLIPHLPHGFDFVEPCAGDNSLTRHLVELTGGMAKPILTSDIEPQSHDVVKMDAFDLTESHVQHGLIITNPPWDRSKKSGYLLHEMIDHFSELAPTWLLFDADWVHTIQSGRFMKKLSCMVSVGRVKWIEDSKMTGKDNCQWYLFEKNSLKPPRFFGRI